MSGRSRRPGPCRRRRRGWRGTPPRNRWCRCASRRSSSGISASTLRRSRAQFADQAVVHEHPAAAGERMAVRPGDRGAGRGADMGEKEVRADVAAEVAQVLVRPGRAHLAIEARLGVLAVPAQPEAVAVGAGGRFERVQALHHQRMGGRGHVLFERDRSPRDRRSSGTWAGSRILSVFNGNIARPCGKAKATVTTILLNIDHQRRLNHP